MPKKVVGVRGKIGWCLLALVTLVVAACGGGGGGSKAAAGAPIKVMLLGTISSESFSAGETVNGAEAAAGPINAAGGINGHKIDILTCNDQFLPNVNATCGRSAVSDNVSAVIEVETDYMPESLAFLQPAHIPLLGDSPGNPQELTDSNVFPIAGGAYASISALGTAAVQLGHCQRTAVIVLNFAADELSGRSIAFSIEAAGGKVTKIYEVAYTLPSYSGVVASAIAAGADCITQVLAPAQVTSLLEAIRSSSKPNMEFIGSAGDITPAGFTAMRYQLTGDIWTTDQYLVPTSEATGTPTGAVSTFESDMKTYEPAATVDEESLSGWEAMTEFVDAARTVSNYSASSMLAAMSKLHNVNIEGLPVPVSYNAANPNPKMPRVTDTDVLVYQLEDGLYHLLPTKIDVTNSLGNFLKSSQSSI